MVKDKVILNGYEKMRLLSCGVNNNFRGFPAKALTQYIAVPIVIIKVEHTCQSPQSPSAEI